MRVRADVVEDLGAESHVVFPIDAPRVSADAVRAAADAASDDEGKLFLDDQRAIFTAVVDPRRAVGVGGEVEFAVDHARFHFFDPATGEAVMTASREPAGAPS